MSTSFSWVLEAPASAVVGIQPIRDAAAGPDFGSDVSTTLNGDLDPTFAVITGSQVLAEALFRRLTQPRGGLLSDPNYGIDVRDTLNGAYSEADIARLKSDIERECEKDERVVTAQSDVAFVAITGELRITVSVGTAQGPFTLVLAVNNVTATLISFT
jgi:hypothetical protein